MRTRIASRNKTLLYLVVFAIIILAFLLLGGGPWIKEMAHGRNSPSMAHLKWGQIIISLGLGFLLGLVVSKRKW